MKHLLGIILASAAALSAYAGIVRILPASDDKMEPIRLKLGNSTILRFVDKPRTRQSSATQDFSKSNM